GERLVANQFARRQHRVTQAQSLFLPNVGDVDHVRNLAHDLQQVVLALFFEHLFQFVADVEMIFNRTLAASRNNDDLVATRCQSLFHAILNDGFVDQRQHLFRLRLGGGKKTRAQTSGGKNRFADSASVAAIAVGASLLFRLHCRIILNVGCPSRSFGDGVLPRPRAGQSPATTWSYVVCAETSRASNSSSKSRSVCKMPSALSILIENFRVPSGLNCVPRCEATKRASFSASIAAVWLNLILTNSRLRSMAFAPTRIACSFSAAYSSRFRTARGVSP